MSAGHRTFEGAAEDYQRLVEGSFGFIGRRLDFFAAQKARVVMETMRGHLADVASAAVLDVGCGIGTLGAHISASVGSFRGIDVAPDMVAVARLRDPRGMYDAYDGTTLPYAPATFDVACTINVLHHIDVPGRPRFMAEMERVVRPGGLLVIIEHNPWNPLTRLAVRRCALDALSELLAMRDVIGLIRSQGLSIVSARHVLVLPVAGRLASAVERRLAPFPLGAQHMVTARVPTDRRSRDENELAGPANEGPQLRLERVAKRRDVVVPFDGTSGPGDEVIPVRSVVRDPA